MHTTTKLIRKQRNVFTVVRSRQSLTSPFFANFNEFYSSLVIVCYCYFHCFVAISISKLIIVKENKEHKSHSLRCGTFFASFITFQTIPSVYKFDYSDNVMIITIPRPNTIIGKKISIFLISPNGFFAHIRLVQTAFEWFCMQLASNS